MCCHFPIVTHFLSHKTFFDYYLIICLRVDWVYNGKQGPVYLIKSYIFYLLMSPCFTNRSCPHITKSLGSFPPYSVIEFDPMTGKSLQETVSFVYLCVLGGFLMHEGVQTLLSCDIMYGIKNWTSVPKIAHLCSLCIEEWSKQILFGGGLVYLSFLLNLTTLNSNR